MKEPTDREIKEWLIKNKAPCACPVCVEATRYKKAVMDLIKQ